MGWSLTVPLQIIKFYSIPKAVEPVPGSGIFWRWLIGTIVMFAFDYIGEPRSINPWFVFATGMTTWVFILCEVFDSEDGQLVQNKVMFVPVGAALISMRFIVTAYESICTLGYLFGCLMGTVNGNVLNLTSNWQTCSTS